MSGYEFRTSAAAMRFQAVRHALGISASEFDALDPPQEVAYRDLFLDRSAHSQSLHGWAQRENVHLRSFTRTHRRRGSRSEKFLFSLRDGYAIEAVLIRRRDGYTACISSQVGCAFACRFCASGRAGLFRNLEAGEIVEQVVELGARVTRIVFMGIGEPLNNYENVLRAIRILRDRRGLDFPTTGITISTVGIPKQLKRLREEHLGINLTISLHATTQEMRDRLIPGARKHPIGDVIGNALSWAERHRRTVTFVYLVLPGINDTPADASRLIGFLRGSRARLNLMRWNPVEGAELPRTADRSLTAFRAQLLAGGIPTTVRDTQGRDVSAACGQLWLRNLQGAAIAAGAPLAKRGAAR